MNLIIISTIIKKNKYKNILYNKTSCICTNMEICITKTKSNENNDSVII